MISKYVIPAVICIACPIIPIVFGLVFLGACLAGSTSETPAEEVA